ncbi:hypothetical protein BKA62DRAFT_697179 [Auriculariales sp. MPI-PUGE-AT-0066]|nr:hypothetical protein BKA62DRAFT_697179 [Auriculariales sp. MPI-PUGE-AT-0066]
MASLLTYRPRRPYNEPLTAHPPVTALGYDSKFLADIAQLIVSSHALRHNLNSLVIGLMSTWSAADATAGANLAHIIGQCAALRRLELEPARSGIQAVLQQTLTCLTAHALGKQHPCDSALQSVKFLRVGPDVGRWESRHIVSNFARLFTNLEHLALSVFVLRKRRGEIEGATAQRPPNKRAGLRTLYLYKTAEGDAQYILESHQSLKSLILFFDKDPSETGETFSQTLRSIDCTVMSLDLDYTPGVGRRQADDPAPNWADIISHCPRIRRLSVRSYAASFSQMLQVLPPTLRTLILSFADAHGRNEVEALTFSMYPSQPLARLRKLVVMALPPTLAAAARSQHAAHIGQLRSLCRLRRIQLRVATRGAAAWLYEPMHTSRHQR